MNAARAVVVCALVALAVPAQTFLDVNRGTVWDAGKSTEARLGALGVLLMAGGLDAETAAKRNAALIPAPTPPAAR